MSAPRDPESTATTRTRAGASRRKLPWVGMLYFVEGTPFGVVNDLVPLWLDSLGVSKTSIGLLSFLELPWSIKFLWAWLVDWFGTRRRWIFGALLAEAAVLAAAGMLGAGNLWVLALTLLAYTAASATVDIAIDAYTIELTEPGEEGPVNATRAVSYRAAWFVAGGVGVGGAAVIGWSGVIWGIAALMLLFAVATLRAPHTALETARRERGDSPAPTGPRLASYAAALRSWMLRPGALAVVLTAVLYKLPDSSMGPMPRLFWRHSGLSLEQIGWVITTINLGSLMLGSVAGGLWIARIGVLRGLLWCGVAQLASNLVYAVVAGMGGSAGAIFFATGFENFTGGLGTAALLSFLMRMCSKEQAALEYALLSALFALARFPAKMISGYGAEALGYAWFFFATGLVAVPGLAVLFSRALAARIGEPPLIGHGSTTPPPAAPGDRPAPG